jgi:hypothetical protein
MICVVVHPFNCHDCQNISLEHFFNLHETFSPHTGCHVFMLPLDPPMGMQPVKNYLGPTTGMFWGPFERYSA